MRKIASLALFLTCLLCGLATSSLDAQGFQRLYGGYNFQIGTPQHEGIVARQTVDQGFIFMTDFPVPSSGPVGTWIIKTDPNGNKEWERQLFWPQNVGTTLIQTSDGGYLLSGKDYGGLFLGSWIMKLDAFGATEWEQAYPGTQQHLALMELSGGNGYIACGTAANLPTQIGWPHILKIDTTGTEVWRTVLPNFTGTYDFLDHLLETSNGGILAMGASGSNSSYFPYSAELAVVKLDQFGSVNWSNSYNFGANYHLSGGAIELLGNQYLVSAIAADIVGSNIGPNALLITLDGQGNQVNIVRDTIAGTIEIKSFNLVPGKGYAATGSIWPQMGPESLLTLKWDTQLNRKFTTILGNYQYQSGNFVEATREGGTIVAGTAKLNNSARFSYFSKTDSLGHAFSSLITGHVFHDQNSNCNQDNQEPGQQNRLLRVTPGPYYTTTDSNGFYEIEADTGQFNIELLPQSYWGLNCPSTGSYSGNMPNTNDTLSGIDFSSKVDIYCPLMEVNLGVSALRLCRQSTFWVHYCNKGTDVAVGAYVDIEFDSTLTVNNSSIPWTTPQNGNLYSFPLGNVAPGVCDSFYVRATVTCDSLYFQATHCVEAHIYPDSLCDSVNTAWDGSSVEVEATCPNQNQVELTVTNVGQAAMSLPGSVIILEDNVMKAQFTMPSLGVGQDTVVYMPANGATWHIIADQSNGHPGLDRPVAFCEGCGRNGANSFSRGFVTTLPVNDADPFVDILCLENSIPWDPNDKRTFPSGVGLSKYVQAADDLEYHIRFQNTGNDSAFRVVIRDTLPPYVDPSTLIPGASSHAYTWRLYQQNIVEWTFDNINLPDSNVNEPASHGFVRFTIQQTPQNPNGTLIENSAAIWFDFNAPVITQLTFVTIGERFFGEVYINEPLDEKNLLKVYPNPFSESATFAFDHTVPRNLDFEVYDLTGRRVYAAHFPHTHQFTLQRGNLKSGLHLFRISENGRLLGSGRIVVD